MSENAEHADKNVEIWKVKKLIKSLEAARGNGTSMISLIIPPGDQACISRVSKMLADEYGTASNIKSRVNRLVLDSLYFKYVIKVYNVVLTHLISCHSRLSVLGAITSVQHRLKLYTKVQSEFIRCGHFSFDLLLGFKFLPLRCHRTDWSSTVAP